MSHKVTCPPHDHDHTLWFIFTQSHIHCPSAWYSAVSENWFCLQYQRVLNLPFFCVFFKDFCMCSMRTIWSCIPQRWSNTFDYGPVYIYICSLVGDIDTISCRYWREEGFVASVINSENKTQLLDGVSNPINLLAYCTCTFNYTVK